MPKMSGAQYIAESFKGYGVTHAFLVPAILRKGLVEMEKLGIKPIVTHGEKAAAYIADGSARASTRVGICIARSVGSATLAAGVLATPGSSRARAEAGPAMTSRRRRSRRRGPLRIGPVLTFIGGCDI